MEKEQEKLLFGKDRIFTPEWREVILLLAGVLHKQGPNKVNRLIDHILNHMPQGQEAKLLPQQARSVHQSEKGKSRYLNLVLENLHELIQGTTSLCWYPYNGGLPLSSAGWLHPVDRSRRGSSGAPNAHGEWTTTVGLAGLCERPS